MQKIILYSKDPSFEPIEVDAHIIRHSTMRTTSATSLAGWIISDYYEELHSIYYKGIQIIMAHIIWSKQYKRAFDIDDTFTFNGISLAEKIRSLC